MGVLVRVSYNFIMQFLVLLSAVTLALTAPMPEGEEAPAALPYVHDVTGETAEAYVHDAAGDVAEAYVHEEPVVAAVSYATHPYTVPVAYHTGCVNNVGSVVPCA